MSILQFLVQIRREKNRSRRRNPGSLRGSIEEVPRELPSRVPQPLAGDRLSDGSGASRAGLTALSRLHPDPHLLLDHLRPGGRAAHEPRRPLFKAFAELSMRGAAPAQFHYRRTLFGVDERKTRPAGKAWQQPARTCGAGFEPATVAL